MSDVTCIAAYNYQDGTASLHFSSGSAIAVTQTIEPSEFLNKPYGECLKLLGQVDLTSGPHIANTTGG